MRHHSSGSHEDVHDVDEKDALNGKDDEDNVAKNHNTEKEEEEDDDVHCNIPVVEDAFSTKKMVVVVDPMTMWMIRSSTKWMWNVIVVVAVVVHDEDDHSIVRRRRRMDSLLHYY
jgi:hypothetical protein